MGGALYGCVCVGGLWEAGEWSSAFGGGRRIIGGRTLIGR